MSELTGIVKEIIFQNEKNGYTVALFETTDNTDDIGIQTTITGTLFNVKKGSLISIKGDWVNHAVYGEQFKVDSFSLSMPKTKESLENYFKSGAIKGISKKTANSIIEKYGDNFFEVLEDSPEELLKIKGIGKKTLEKIIIAFRDENDNISILAQLQDYGISSRIAKKIFDVYKNDTVNVLLGDPYDLALKVQGIGFAKADEIANKIGFDKSDSNRILAGIIYALMDCYRSGHTYLEREDLIQKATKLLELPRELIEDELANAVFSDRIYEYVDLDNNRTIYYPIELYKAESDSALLLSRLADEKIEIPEINQSELINKIESRLNFTLDDIQKEAILAALDNPITIITGGPGTGKSATRSIVK